MNRIHLGNVICMRPATLVLILGITMLPLAHAQEAQTLDTIIVTSQGRSEELQKAAAPIAVFSEVHIQDAGISNTADFVRLVPNMSYDTSFTIGNSFVRMRGIQQLNNADAPVAIVVDGVPQNNQKEFKMDLFDIEQIEVMRGPQGALYGRNAVAGAIVINTKQPGNFNEGFIQGEIGGYGLRKISGSTSGPIVDDRLFYRLSLSGSDFDGAINNSFLNEKVDWSRGHDLRGQLKWLPSDHQQVEWRMTSSALRGGAIFDTSFPKDNPDNTNIWQEPLSDFLGISSRRIKSSSLKYRWEGEAVNLTSISSYTNLYEDYYGDLDFCNPVVCPGGLFDTLGQAEQSQVLNVHQASQEIRLSAAEHALIQWTAGAYVLQTRRKLDTVDWQLDFDPPLLLTDAHESNRNQAWAVFAQVQFPLGRRDRLEFSLRLDHDRRRQRDFATDIVLGKSYSAWQPKFTWSHDLGETQMWYLTTGRGFRSGGFNGIGIPEFKPELLTSYELGHKSSWLDNRLTFNNALFYEYDKDYQFFYINLDIGGGGQVIANLNRVEIMGLESEFNWRVQPGWEVFASLGLLASRIKDVGQLSTDLPITRGRRAPRTEPWNAVLGSQWNFPLGAYRAMFRVDVSHQAKRTWEADNLYLMDPVTLVNTRLTFFSHRQWNMTAWASNLFNHRYYADFSSDAFGGLGRDIGFPAPGRRYGLDFRYDF